MHEPCAPHLSWGTLLHRSDDRNPVSLFQGEAVASVAGPYLGRTAGLVTDGAEAATDRHQTDCFVYQKRLGDDVFHYFQVVLHGLVLGVGALHLLIGKEPEQ